MLTNILKYGKKMFFAVYNCLTRSHIENGMAVKIVKKEFLSEKRLGRFEHNFLFLARFGLDNK